MTDKGHVIRWLHLSDTHFEGDVRWDRRATLNALIDKVRELKEDGLAPDLVFVTGDIAFSGKPKEYEQATLFFHRLNEVLELDPKTRWFLVPGNHDVDRSRIKGAHRAVTKSLNDEAAIEEILLRDPDSLRSLSTRLEAYYIFASAFIGPARALQTERPWRSDVCELDGISVGILQLNSAWIAEGGKADDANLLVGEAQVREALHATPDALFRIALMHHPRRNLRDFDEGRLTALLGGKDGAAFLLRGHLHINRTKIEASPDGSLIELAAGTLYTDETTWPRGFHLGEADLGKGEARIHLFRFSGEGRGFFAPDNLTYENAPDGVSRIKLPRALRLGGAKPRKPKAVSEAQRLSVTARYRAAAANYHGHARFIGFPNQAARPNASVGDLFVPLRMKRLHGTPETEPATTEWIAQCLLQPPTEGMPVRIVVLGDPGSGKTTLTRFLVMVACGAISLPGVEVAEDRLPIRVAFREFVEQRRSNPALSLAEYLEWQIKTELSVALPKTFLADAMESGRAILLLDGLDEVGGPEHREAMRNLVASFAACHPRMPILVTSRIAGYDEASLAERSYQVGDEKHVLVLFSELVLAPFSDDDLSSFVKRWYSVQEPSNPVARERGIADLIGALNADHRVRELARTPILATLIAMIHRVEATLPGERAKLYELCVRMLMETWPAQARRMFTEIDPGLQRAYLESLAFEMQKGRSSDDEAVTITRAQLVARLSSILRRRDLVSEPEEKVTGLVVRWIDHLERNSGIVVEQSTGVYAFFHLSIMEYLAARGMEREMGGPGAVKSIAEHFADSTWREVCLLAVGSHAEDGEFLDAVFESVGTSEDVERWDFLIRSLREEAHFRSEQREIILERYARTVLEIGRAFTDLQLIDQIRAFSLRHGAAVRGWIEDRLALASGDELATAVVIGSGSAFEILEKRPDRADVAGALLEFWPGSVQGEWAARNVGAAAALRWSASAPDDLALLRGFAGVGAEPEPLVAATLPVILTRALRACARARVSLRLLAEDGKRLPAKIGVEPGQSLLSCSPRSPPWVAQS